MPIIVAGYLQRAGHRPIIPCGGTAMIGDPSGKSDLRKMMSRETIRAKTSPAFKRSFRASWISATARPSWPTTATGC